MKPFESSKPLGFLDHSWRGGARFQLGHLLIKANESYQLQEENVMLIFELELAEQVIEAKRSYQITPNRASQNSPLSFV